MATNDAGNDVNISGRMRPFMSYRSRYATLSSIKERCGSNSSLASVASTISGSSQNLLDPLKLMSMQDDARCRKISAEVMKRCLYKPDAPCRRRAYSRTFSGNSHGPMPSRMIQSMPATPMHSLTTSPSQSPTNAGGFFYPFLSRGTTPRVMTPEPEEEDEEEDEADAGLASVLRPQPRYVRALPPKTEEEAAASCLTPDSSLDGSCTKSGGFGAIRRPAYRFRSLNMNVADSGLSS